MKILKYLLIAIILIALYITYPLWQLTSGQGSTDVSQVDEYKAERKAMKNAEEEALMAAEEKFGPKPSVAYQSRVPEPVQRYWDATLKADESIYEDICSPLQVTSEGWSTSCQYKIKSAKGLSPLRLDKYTIKNGEVVK